MGGVKPGNEIPLLTSSFYLLNDGGTAGAGFGLSQGRSISGQGPYFGVHARTVFNDKPAYSLHRDAGDRLVSRHRSGGEFGWGGISVT